MSDSSKANVLALAASLAAGQERIATTLLWCHFWGAVVYGVALSGKWEIAPEVLTYNLSLLMLAAINYGLFCVLNGIVNIAAIKQASKKENET